MTKLIAVDFNKKVKIDPKDREDSDLEFDNYWNKKIGYDYKYHSVYVDDSENNANKEQE